MFADYKQARCINLAKRGMLALNVDWIGMGQLRSPENAHALLNHLDLCGTSGLAVFYLLQTRGVDVLLAHEHVDPGPDRRDRPLRRRLADDLPGGDGPPGQP